MVTQVPHGPQCQGTNLVRHGITPQGEQRHRCRETSCQGGTFLLDYSYPGRPLHSKEQIVEADADQAVGTPDDLLFEDGAYARSGHRIVRQQL
jgi:hypothetical protein